MFRSCLRSISNNVCVKHRSIVEIGELELTEWLASNPVWRSYMFNLQGINEESIPFCNVPMAGLPENPRGDVDILLIPPNLADEPTAIQVKRIKVSPAAIRSGQPNKIQELGLAKRQA